MSRAKTLAQLLGSDGALTVADVSGAVNKAGDSMTGPLSVSGPHSAASPLLDLVASSGGGGAGTYLRGSRLLDPTMVAGQKIMYGMGRADSAKNMGQVYYGYAGAGSDSNYIALGLHSVDDAFQVMGNGCVKMNFQPAFLASIQANEFTLSGGSTSAIIYGVAIMNRGGYYNTGNGRFTAPVSGVYTFTHNLSARPTSATIYEVKLFKNGSAEIARNFHTPTNTPHHASCSVVVSLAAGDYVTAGIYTTGSTFSGMDDITPGQGQGIVSGFFGHLIG